MRQANESIDEIFIFVIDETYNREDDHGWAVASEEYRKGLENEFNCTATDADIGPSASIPAFLVTLAAGTVPMWTLMPLLFFAGKPIKENFEAWREVASKVRRFFKRSVVLARNGAAALAFEAVLNACDQNPSSVALLSYRTLHMTNVDDLLSLERSEVIEDGLDTLYLGFAAHLFELQADDRQFRVLVRDREVSIVELIAARF